MIKVIFLDIDGVLNVIGQERDQYGSLFHKHFEDNLRWIIELTGAKIVISSTWRLSGFKVMKQMWLDRNLPGEVIGITRYDLFLRNDDLTFEDRCERGTEIQHYIDEHKIERYCILDDDTDMLPHQKEFFVKTSDNIDHEDCIDIGYGLTKKCAEQAIKILNK